MWLGIRNRQGNIQTEAELTSDTQCSLDKQENVHSAVQSKVKNLIQYDIKVNFYVLKVFIPCYVQGTITGNVLYPFGAMQLAGNLS